MECIFLINALFVFPADPFTNWAREQQLTPETIAKLIQEGLNNFRALQLMKEDNIKHLNLNMGQTILLQDAIQRLNPTSQAQGESTELNIGR